MIQMAPGDTNVGFTPTGDDVACLRDLYLTPDDEDYEKKLTIQARPNVIFEMGMAFGKYPDRTIIVEFGRTRPFTDILGRNTIRYSSGESFRKKLADRLETAGCPVRIKGKSHWLSAGDFAAAVHRQEPAEEAGLLTKKTAASLPKQPESEQVPNPLVSDGKNELVVSSRDDYLVRISRYQQHDTKGLVATVINNRLSAIIKTTLRVRKAQSFDSRYEDYRDGRNFNAFQQTYPKPIEASSSSDGMLLVRKDPSSEDLLIGNDAAHPLRWPPLDTSAIHKWLLLIDVSTESVPPPGKSQGKPLITIVINLVMIWNKEKNEFFVDIHQPSPITPLPD